MSAHRVFLLSPANCGGLRAQFLLNENAEFDMAARLRAPGGAPLGDIFSFLSGLYFRGKLTYARAFARPPAKAQAVLVITPNRGLLSPDILITRDELRSLAEVDIDADDPRYRDPLTRDARRLAALAPNCDVVLLGSIATGKYTRILLDAFGTRLKFPSDFVGRGDMSRGGLMLRRVTERQELEYIAVDGAVCRGNRPAKLPKATVKRPS